jgi:hypothetical protein
VITNGTDTYDIPFDKLKDAPGGKLSYAAEALDFPRPDESFSGLLRVFMNVVNNKDEVVKSDEVMLTVAPYVMCANIDTVTHVYVMDYDSDFHTDLGTLLAGTGAARVTVDDSTYGNDVWVQDEFEFGYATRPKTAAAQTTMHVCLNSYRIHDGTSGLDPYPEAELLAADFGEYDTPGSGVSVTGDSYGNLELTPNLTGFPRGAIYVGDSMSDEGRQFLSAQRVQARRDSGTVSASTATTLTDSTKNWATDEWEEGIVIITAGKGRGQIREITDNSQNELTVSSAWDLFESPNETSKYIVSKSIELPVSWLHVKHVDEVITFVPDASDDFKLLVADPNLGLKLLADQLAWQETGAVSSVPTNKKFQVNGKSWTTDFWKEGFVYITSGTGKGQFRRVQSNTSDTVTLWKSWDTNPDSGDGYILYAMKVSDIASGVASGEDKLTDTTNAGWANDQWKHGFVKITGGALSGQVRQIKTNTGTVITVTRNWMPQSDSGTASSGTNDTLVDAADGKSWVVNLWQGGKVKITAGTGAGQERTVSSSDATSLTVSEDWETNPSDDSQYTVTVTKPNVSSKYELEGRGNYRAFFFKDGEDLGVSTRYESTVDRLVDHTKSWVNDQWNGGHVFLIHDGALTEFEEIDDTVSASDTGTSTGASDTTLADSSKSWATNDWAGGEIEITGGPGNGQKRTIASNTPNTITVSPAWATNPFKADSGTAESGGDDTLTDTDKSWDNNEWQGGKITITAGTGNGQTRDIASNTDQQITVTENWETNPGDDSEYELTLGASYEVKTTYLEITGIWDNDPTETSKYVVIGESLLSGSSTPAAGLVTEALEGHDMRLHTGNHDNLLVVKNTAIWKKIWHDNDGVLESLRTSVGASNLPDSKIVSVPSLFMMHGTAVIDDVSHADAFVPGMVNLLVVKGTASTKAIIAKPFGCKSGGNDVFETKMNQKLTGVITTSYIDDWDTYHVKLGEVHCGTNVKRNLPADKKWWDE